jgi:D-serine deaminase-like pyridoxal phosphate-dependent protein
MHQAADLGDRSPGGRDLGCVRELAGQGRAKLSCEIRVGPAFIPSMVRPIPYSPERYRIPETVMAHLMTPALVVFLERVRENLKNLVSRAGGPSRLRPHVKTAKIPEVFAESVRAGIRHFKCATTREAEQLLAVLRAEGIAGADVLVAYPHLGPNLARLGTLARAHPESVLSVLVEDLEVAVPEPLGIFADVNCGMDRTGVPLSERSTISAIVRRAGSRFRGLHAYEGHVHEGSYPERKAICFSIYDELMELSRALGGVPELVTSGTPSFTAALEYEPFRGIEHKVSPGTVVYFDHRYHTDCEELDFVPAALVLSRVVSYPTDRRFTCDAGSKAIASEAGSPVAVILGHPEHEACEPNEEHLPFETAAARPKRGDTVLLFPRHVCPTVNLAEEALLVDRSEARPVAVRARAHDLVIG